jgi:hypothetical protein
MNLLLSHPVWPPRLASLQIVTRHLQKPPEESSSSVVALYAHGPLAEPSIASSLQDTTRPEATTGFATSNQMARCLLPFASGR